MGDVDLAAVTGFQWDSGNRIKSQMKHGVTQAEAEELFLMGPLVLADPGHSVAEPRFHALGESGAGRRLFAVFTVRDDRIRIISVRDMSRRERRRYEEAQRHLKEGSSQVP